MNSYEYEDIKEKTEEITDEIPVITKVAIIFILLSIAALGIAFLLTQNN